MKYCSRCTPRPNPCLDCHKSRGKAARELPCDDTCLSYRLFKEIGDRLRYKNFCSECGRDLRQENKR